jgi:ribosomal protein S18 acetylase RimI-like enzyme
MTVRIRPMLEGDKPAVMSILRATPEFNPAELVVAEEVIDSYLADPQGSGYNMLVADDPAISGYIGYGPTPLTEGTWDVYWIAAAPQKKGKGIGSALLTCAEDKIKEAGGRLIVIETSSLPSYERTRRFYSKHNYEAIARVPDFYAPGDDKIILQKRLKTTRVKG